MIFADFVLLHNRATKISMSVLCMECLLTRLNLAISTVPPQCGKIAIYTCYHADMETRFPVVSSGCSPVRSAGERLEVVVGHAKDVEPKEVWHRAGRPKLG